MSEIKSNSDDLVLNSDGGTSTIKFQTNGVERGSISTTGAFTATTIDATALTGALPAISGASLTNLPAGGVAGIVSTANATAITIDANENVGIGTTSPTTELHIYSTLVTELLVETSTADQAFTHYKTSATSWSVGQQGGAGGSFKISNATSLGASEAIVIDTSGRVMMPNQVMFSAYSGNQTGTSLNPITFSTVQFDVGSNYNNTNYRFTAPVAGKYSITVDLALYAASDCRHMNLTIYKNGGGLGNSDGHITRGTNVSGTNTHTMLTWSDIIDLAANDYITAGYTSDFSTTLYGSSGRTHFTGFLVG